MQVATTTPAPPTPLYGQAAAAADKELTLADMLTYAIEDEWLAHGEYAGIIADLGAGRPFTNIVQAEVRWVCCFCIRSS